MRRLVLLACAILAVVLAAVAQIAKEGQPRMSWVLLVGASLLVAIPGVVAASAWGQQRRDEAAKRAELARDRTLDRRLHFETAARGVAQSHWAGSLFTGRERVLRALAAWLADDSAGALRVVVGQPGSGKSAVLGRLVELADPAKRKFLAGTPADCLPPARSVHVELTARGRTLPELVARIAAEVRLTASSVDELVLGLQDRKTPLTVVLDGLNESAEPDLVARELVGRLADREDGTGLRMVVGTRPGALHSIGVPAEEIIDLDGPDYFDQEDLVEYTRKCLREFTTHGDVPGDDIAMGIAGRAGTAFLVAQLTARAIGRDTAQHWRERFPDSVGAALEAYLDRVPDGRQARTLLMPLAFARGDGLAPDGLWATLASALGTESVTEQDVRRLVSESPAGTLVTRSTSGRYRLYHEAFAEHLRNTCPHESPHSAIAARLREPATGGWSAAHPYVREQLATHAANANALDELLGDAGYLAAAAPAPLLRALSHVTTPAATQAAEVYRGVAHHIRRQPDLAVFYLELYARQRGYDRLADAWVRGMPERTVAVPWARCRVSQPHRVIGRHEADISAVRAIAARDLVVSGDSAGAINVWDVVHGVPVVEELHLSPASVVNDIAALRDAGDLVLLVASDAGLYTIHVGAQLTRVDGRAVTTISVLDQDGRVVTGDRDGRLCLWELCDTARLVASVAAHPEGVISTGVGTVAGRLVVVSAGFSGSIMIWEPAPDGLVQLAGWFSGQPRMALAVADPVILGGSEDGSVWIRPVDGPATMVRREDDAPASTLSLVRLRGRDMVLTGGFAGEINMWDPNGGARLAGPLSGHMGWVTALDAAARGPVDSVLSGGDDGYVRCWDLDLGRLPDQQADTGDTATVSAMDVGAGFVLSGRADGILFVLDPASGANVTSPIAVSRHGVRCLRVTRLRGSPAVLCGSYDGTLNAVALDGTPLIDHPVRAHSRALRALCVLDGAVLTGGDGGVVRWDPATWQPEHKFDGDPEVYAVAATREVLICGGYAGIHIVELSTGRRVAGPLQPDRLCRALTVTEMDGRPVVVSGGEAGIGFWDLADGSPAAPPVATDEVTTLATVDLGGGPAIVWGDHRGITLWSPVERRQLARLDLGFPVTAVAGLATGDLIVSAFHGVYRLNTRLDGDRR